MSKKNSRLVLLDYRWYRFLDFHSVHFYLDLHISSKWVENCFVMLQLETSMELFFFLFFLFSLLLTHIPLAFSSNSNVYKISASNNNHLIRKSNLEYWRQVHDSSSSFVLLFVMFVSGRGMLLCDCFVSELECVAWMELPWKSQTRYIFIVCLYT